jgi:hypothetical protein
MTAIPAMTYPPELPATADGIPEGQILVHNRVLPARRQGWRGFRYWYQAPSDRAEPCRCGWAPGLGVHYRIKPELVWWPGNPAEEDPS